MPPRVFTFACAQYARHRISPLNSEPRSIQPLKNQKARNRSRKHRKTCTLTPVLRSGYPPCAAVSLVVLSPTREGRVCDIQLVIIAMVLSTTPIFSKGTVIFALCSDFIQAVFILQTPGRNKGGETWCPERLAVSPGTPALLVFFWTSSTEAQAANESDAGETTKTGRSGRLG